jgi:polygalacturonase
VLSIYDPKGIIGPHGHRPHLFKIEESIGVVVDGIHFINSPMYHVYVLDCVDLSIGNIKISVNRTAQHRILTKYFKWLDKFGLEMFPFNTDGIDPQGRNIHIFNITCENYNDIVVVKPQNKNGRLSQCSENILIENISSIWGSAMAIGTVPPS